MEHDHGLTPSMEIPAADSLSLAPLNNSNDGLSYTLARPNEPASELVLAEVPSANNGPLATRGRHSKAHTPLLTTKFIVVQDQPDMMVSEFHHFQIRGPLHPSSNQG